MSLLTQTVEAHPAGADWVSLGRRTEDLCDDPLDRPEGALWQLDDGLDGRAGDREDAAEEVARRWNEISDRSGEIVPESGAAQGMNEVQSAMAAKGQG